METHSSTIVGRGLRLITLSSFAGDRADALRRQRIQDYEMQCARQRLRLIDFSMARDLALSRAKYSLSGFDLIGAWRSWRESRRAEMAIEQIRRMAPVVRAASIDERQARAGDEAERRLDEFLAVALDDQWTLIAGYSGRGGEIDRILIGPWGVFAFEIKGNRGVIHSDGARWWVERFDRRGNPLETKTLPRAPDAQLAKTAGWLEGWLRRNEIDLRVGRVILFPADDARIGAIHAANADLVATLRELDLGSLFDPSCRGSALAPVVCERIANLVVRDHSFWERRRLGASGTASRRGEGEVSRLSFAGL
jgi:hypothetical protein